MSTTTTIPDGQVMLDWLCSTYLTTTPPETTSKRQTATGAAVRGSASNGGWSQMILDKLTELQPVAMQQAAAAIMPFIPVSYVARNGNGSALRAARVKILSLKKGNRVSITDGIITVHSADGSGGVGSDCETHGSNAGGSGSDALLNRARAYVERSANVAEGGRNAAAFSLSGHLWAMQGESGEQLQFSDVFDLLTDWNQRNSPPLPDSELQRTIRNGRDRGTPPPPKLPDTRAAAEPVGNRSGVVQQQQLATAADYEPRRPFPLGQTMQSPEPLHEPILNGLLRRGETMNLVAAPKTGKSWLVTQMALSVATGRLWIGFSTTPGKVLLCDNELHRATLEHRFQTVAEAMDVDLQAAEQNLLALCLRGDLAGGLMQLELDLQQFAPGELALLIVDAKYRLDGAQDENSNAEQTAFFNRVDQLAARLDCAVVLVHHASKGLQTGKHVTDVGAGAGAQSRAADVHFVIRPHEQPGMAVVDAVCRSFRPIEPLSLRHEWPLWKITLGVEPVLKAEQTRGDRRQASKDQDGIEQLARVFRRVGEPMARNALKTEAGMGADRLNRLIAKMRDEDQLTISTTTHTNGTTIELFSLAEPAEPDDPEAPSEIHRPPSDLFSDDGS